MTEVFILLAVCSIMGCFYYELTKPILADGYNIKKKNNKAFATLLFIIILCTLICFSGLRTRMNDTNTYMRLFVERVPHSLAGILDVDWEIGMNPLFRIYQILLKVFISESSNVFIFVTSCIVTTSMVMFLKKYSLNFGYSLFLFLAFVLAATSAFATLGMASCFNTGKQEDVVKTIEVKLTEEE